MLTVSEETSFGIPPLIWAWRLGIWPWPAWSTWPKTTCSTWSGATSARSSAAAMAVPPRSVASSEASAPPIFPNGVRAAPRITVFGMWQNAIDWVNRSVCGRGALGGDGRDQCWLLPAGASRAGARHHLPVRADPARRERPRTCSRSTRTPSTGAAPTPRCPARASGSRASSRTRATSAGTCTTRPGGRSTRCRRELAPTRAANPFLPGATAYGSRALHRLHRVRPEPAQPAPNTIYTGDSRGGTFLLPRLRAGPRPRREGRRAAAAGHASSPRAARRGSARTRCRELQAPYAAAAQRADRGRAGAARPDRRRQGLPGPQPAAAGGCSRTSAARRSTSCSTTRTARTFHPRRARRAAATARASSRTATSPTSSRGTSRGFGEVLVLRGARRPSRTRARARHDPGRRAAALLLLLPVRARHPAGDRLPLATTAWPVGRARRLHGSSSRRPSSGRATRGAECGVTWMPWGPLTQGLLIYRHMLADPSFAPGDPARRRAGAGARRDGRLLPGSQYLRRRRTSRGAAACRAAPTLIRLDCRRSMAPITVTARSGRARGHRRRHPRGRRLRGRLAGRPGAPAPGRARRGEARAEEGRRRARGRARRRPAPRADRRPRQARRASAPRRRAWRPRRRRRAPRSSARCRCPGRARAATALRPRSWRARC